MVFEDKLISVIIPVYNSEKFLNRCIDSVIKQTYGNLEIILVDDGSTDNSKEICKQYKQSDPRIILVSKHNGGQSSARNAGLDVAVGDYIAFLDSDDWIEPSMYEVLIDSAEKNKVDISQCGYQFAFDIKKMGRMVNFPKFTCDSRSEILDKFFSGEITDVLWNKLYRSEVFLGVRFDETLDSHEDTYILPSIFNNVDTFYSTNRVLYSYFQRENSVSNAKSRETVVNPIAAQEKILDFCNVLHPEFITKAKAQLCLVCIYSFNRSLLDEDKNELMNFVFSKFKLYYTSLKNSSDYNKIPSSLRIKLMLFSYSPKSLCFMYRMYRKIVG